MSASAATVQALGAQTIELFKGQSKTFLLSVKEEPANTPADLTGATVYFTVKRRVGDATAIIAKTSATVTEIEILVPETDGKAKIFLSPSDTNAMSPGNYVYDVWVELVSGKRYPVIEPSAFVLKDSVTVFP